MAEKYYKKLSRLRIQLAKENGYIFDKDSKISADNAQRSAGILKDYIFYQYFATETEKQEDLTGEQLEDISCKNNKFVAEWREESIPEVMLKPVQPLADNADEEDFKFINYNEGPSLKSTLCGCLWFVVGYIILALVFAALINTEETTPNTTVKNEQTKREPIEYQREIYNPIIENKDDEENVITSSPKDYNIDIESKKHYKSLEQIREEDKAYKKSLKAAQKAAKKAEKEKIKEQKKTLKEEKQLQKQLEKQEKKNKKKHERK